MAGRTTVVTPGDATVVKYQTDRTTVVSTDATGPTGPGYSATSTTSLAIGTGTKTFTTQGGLAYLAGLRVRAVSAANSANYMEGTVTSYSGTTLVVSVDVTGGSGTLADWNIGIAGSSGSPGWFDVRVYGAAGNGTTDDTTAVAAALADATAAGGGTVYFPAGDYKITSGLTISGAAESDSWQGGGIHLVGESARRSRIVGASGFTLLTYTSNLAAYCSIEKLSLIGPGLATASGVAMSCNIAPHLRLDQVYIRGWETGVTAYDCTGWTWTDVRVVSCGYGTRLGYNSDLMTFVDVEWRESTVGLEVGWASGSYTGDSQYCNALQFQGSAWAYCTTGLIVKDKNAKGLTFSGGYWEGNTKDIEFGVSGRSDLSGAVGVLFDGCMFSATTSPPRPVAVDVFGRPSLRFVACSTDGDSRYTLFVRMNDINGGSCVIEDCKINAVTAALNVGSRNWNTTSEYQETIRWGRRESDHVDTVNVPASVPLRELRAYNGASRTLMAWGRSTLAGATTNEFLLRDVSGVLQMGGGSTAAFITATSVAALPTASANYQGCLAFVAGGAGVADQLWVCLKKSDDSYAWQMAAHGVDAATILSGLGGIASSLVDAKGDLLTATADNTPARLAVGANGSRVVADSGATTGLTWAAGFGGYRSGVWYEPKGATTGLRTFAANALYVVPYLVRSRQTFDRIAIEVTTAGSAGTVYRLGIFSGHTDGFPGAVVLDAGTVAGDGSLGAVAATINQELAPGLYWLGVACQSHGGSPAIRGLVGGSPGGVDIVQAPGASGGAGMAYQVTLLYSASGAFSSLAAVVPSGTSTLGPALMLRAA